MALSLDAVINRRKQPKSPPAEAVPAMPSTADIDAQMEQVKAEASQLEARITAITAEIAGNWQVDNTQIENEGARLAVRLKATQNRLESLAGERREAFKREVLAAHTAACQRIADARARQSGLKAQIDALAPKLEALNRQHEHERQIVHDTTVGLGWNLTAAADDSPYGREILAELTLLIQDINTRFSVE